MKIALRYSLKGLGQSGAFGALRSRNYRLYWSGLFVAIMGWQVLTFTQLWLVYELTNSPVYVGAVGGVNGAANITLSMFGGAIADRVDKRRLLLFTQSIMSALAFVLATLTFTGVVTVWHVLIIAGLTGTVSAFDSPTRQALLPQLIDDRKDMANAVALSSSDWSASRVLGPAIAGGLTAAFGPAMCFYLTAVGYAVMVTSLVRLNVSGAISASTRAGFFREIKEGWGFVLTHSIFFTLIAMTFLNSIFGMSFVYLLPIFARDILGAGVSGFGFLTTMYGVGSICGTVAVALTARLGHKGKMLAAGSSTFGLLLVAFSFSRSYGLSLALTGAAGFFNALYMTNVATSLQSLVPDNLRGRVMGIYGLTWSLMPLGGLQAGLLAASMGAPFAVALGGTAILSFAIIMAVVSRQVRNLS